MLESRAPKIQEVLLDVSDSCQVWVSGLDQIPKSSRSCHDNLGSLVQDPLLFLNRHSTDNDGNLNKHIFDF